MSFSRTIASPLRGATENFDSQAWVILACEDIFSFSTFPCCVFVPSPSWQMFGF